MEEFKKIVALSFIEAYRNNSLATTKNALAKIISEEINKKENGSLIDEHRYARTLLNYYNYYFNSGKQQTPSDTLINKLLKYLGYDSQKQFTNNQPSDLSYLEEVPFVDDKTEVRRDEPSPNETGQNISKEQKEKLREIQRKKEIKKRKLYIKIGISIMITGMIVVVFYNSISDYFLDKNKEEMMCMTWSENHYEVIDCGKTNSPDIALNRNLLENFRKIKLDTTMTFFKDGKALFWYDKTVGIEFFTMPGTHPTNGKILKPVSQTIIRKYVYKEE
ncbi:hypothetical protein [Aquimarina sp. Aq78]|uniref:hypothetical protein n=1 Tax=Aquimarina sp. Aq78 TaxID=1191889 RepID=UPI000D1083CE|nr:hypothetical protein [Aquimarina sp. Aq78]